MDQEYQCNLCAGKNFIYRDSLTDRLGCDRQRHSVVKCKGCSLHSLFPIPSGTELESIYEDYAKKGDRINVEKLRIKDIYPNKIDLIRKYKPETKTMLDIGSGLGGFASVAKKSGFEVTGLEPQKEQCDMANELFHVDLYCTNFEKFYYQDRKKYDVVHLHHVLEHVRDPKGTLLGIREKLNENGILILEVPNQFFSLKTELYAKLGKANFEKSLNPYHHIYFFSPYTLKKMLLKTDFKILELNDVSKHPSKSNFKNTIKHLLSSILRMGTSSRIEAVAVRSETF
jgi:2-polyprenyl-3-methyl-5-hydroxy-6-metoxy-1,4-benzoquinol methylase